MRTKKFRPREMQFKRASRLGTASESAVWEGPKATSRPPREPPLASPVTKPKRLPPWMAPRESSHLLSPGSTMGQMRSARAAASEGSTPAAVFSTMHNNVSATSIPEAKETEEEQHKKDGDSSDEEVPLAQLQTFRAQRAVEKERIHRLESEVNMLRWKEQEREREEEERKAREEEARRIEAERAYEERKAFNEARRMEKNRKILQEARDRRGFTRASVLMNEPNYGAGNALLGAQRPGVGGRQGSSPSSPNLAGAAASGEPASPNHRAMQQESALAKLQGQTLASRSSTTLFAQQEGQRRSRTSVVSPPEPAISP